jgi:ATP-dependent Lon protease
MVRKKPASATVKRRSKGEDDLLQVDALLHEETPDELELPVLPVRNTVLIPHIVTPMLVGRDHSIKAIEEAMSKDRAVFVVAQKNENIDDPGPDDLYSVGV